ncbi:MAG: hypothetical protein CL760_00495 [Chloroflexi bacterium]|nr:hypothetical protein [Chloroflexota bacterium]|tara:strand:+ start:18870 stop:19133 length:264 start_codon:yes stop_codon:yes gene_type:complete
MAVGGRYQPQHRKIKEIEMTAEQRRRYAKQANIADRKRALLAIYLKNKRKTKRIIEHKKLNKKELRIIRVFILLFILLSMIYFGIKY